MAKALAAAGARVMIADIQDAGAGRQGASARGTASSHLDVTDDDALGERPIGRDRRALGGLDILVNNAGIEITSLLTEVDADDVRTMLEVNILGTTLGIKHGLRTMRPGGAGRHRAARSSTSPRSPRRSRSPASRSTPRPSRRSTG